MISECSVVECMFNIDDLLSSSEVPSILEHMREMGFSVNDAESGIELAGESFMFPWDEPCNAGKHDATTPDVILDLSDAEIEAIASLEAGQWLVDDTNAALGTASKTGRGSVRKGKSAKGVAVNVVKTTKKANVLDTDEVLVPWVSPSETSPPDSNTLKQSQSQSAETRRLRNKQSAFKSRQRNQRFMQQAVMTLRRDRGLLDDIRKGLLRIVEGGQASVLAREILAKMELVEAPAWKDKVFLQELNAHLERIAEGTVAGSSNVD